MSSNNNSAKIKSIEIDSIHRNVTSEIIEITPEKLELILKDHISDLTKENSWHTPLALLLTVLLVLLTADFSDKFGISSPTWEAIFIVALVINVLWFFVQIKKIKKCSTVEELMSKIKNISE